MGIVEDIRDAAERLGAMPPTVTRVDMAPTDYAQLMLSCTRTTVATWWGGVPPGRIPIHSDDGLPIRAVRYVWSDGYEEIVQLGAEGRSSVRVASEG